MNIRLEQDCTYLDNDVETPISLFLREVDDDHGILLESAETDGRWGRHSVIASGFLLTLRCKAGLLDMAIHDNRLEGLHIFNGMPFVQGVRRVMQSVTVVPVYASKEELPPITRALYGYLGYGLAGLFEPSLAPGMPPEDAEACLVLPGTLILFDHQYNKVCRLCLAPPSERGAERASLAPSPTRVGTIRPGMEKQAYLGMVRTIKESIRQGEVIQVVPSVRFQAPFEGAPFTLYRRLRRINPSPYMFFMRLPGISLMGSSPEVMVGCHKGALTLCPIAGTRPRGRGDDQDILFEEELITDPKEQAEHVMLVDLGRNDLGRVAEPGSVVVDRYMEVERFSHVMHLTSSIRARLSLGLDALDVLTAVFPAGTVSGAPKIPAMKIIAASEPSPRGPYAGAIGWLGLDKDSVSLDTGITIRSLWVRAGQIHWQAGGGVVLDSDPAAEWEECNNKAAAVLAAINPREAEKGGRRVPAH